MRISAYWMILGTLVAMIATSCDPCRKLAKSKSIADKDSAAFCYYERDRYESAANLFDELMGYYAASERGEKMHYMFARSKMMMGELLTAAYYFRQYTQRYPNGAHLKEASYRVGYCYDQRSNNYELDQSETENAIEYYKLYLKKYPDSKYAPKAEKRIAALRDRLAHKAFSHANLFYKMENYRAAVVTFKNVLSDYPDSKYREEAQFKLFVAAKKWADLSIESKQLKRYEKAERHYQTFITKFPNSEYIRKAEKAYTEVQEQISKLKAANAENQ